MPSVVLGTEYSIRQRSSVLAFARVLLLLGSGFPKLEASLVLLAFIFRYPFRETSIKNYLTWNLVVLDNLVYVIYIYRFGANIFSRNNAYIVCFVDDCTSTRRRLTNSPIASCQACLF